MDPIGTDKSSRVKECPETLTPADAKSVQLKYKSHDTVSNLEHKLVDPSNRSNRAFVTKVTVADADGASSEVNFRVTPYTAVVLENTASVVVAGVTVVVVWLEASQGLLFCGMSLPSNQRFFFLAAVDRCQFVGYFRHRHLITICFISCQDFYGFLIPSSWSTTP